MPSIESQGVSIYWSTSTAASTADTANVGQVISFNGPTGSANVIDASHLGSVSKEKRMGLPDEGSFSMDLLLSMDATYGQDRLRADRASRTMRKCVIKLTDAPSSADDPTKVIFDGYVTNFAITGAVDEIIKASVTVEIAGKCTWSTGAVS